MDNLCYNFIILEELSPKPLDIAMQGSGVCYYAMVLVAHSPFFSIVNINAVFMVQNNGFIYHILKL